MRQEVMTGAERRRRWSDAEKRSVLAEVGVRGATAAEVARRHDLSRQQIYQWRAELRRRGDILPDSSGFLPVELSTTITTPPAAPMAAPMVEIELANGRRLRGIEGLSAAGLTELIRVLESA